MTTANQRKTILKKAYEIWESEGRPGGREMDHWLQAEHVIAKKKTATKSKAKSKAKAKAKAKPKAPAKTTARKAVTKPKR